MQFKNPWMEVMSIHSQHSFLMMLLYRFLTRYRITYGYLVCWGWADSPKSKCASIGLCNLNVFFVPFTMLRAAKCRFTRVQRQQSMPGKQSKQNAKDLSYCSPVAYIKLNVTANTHSLIAKLKALAQTLWIMEPNTSKFRVFFCEEWNSGEPHQLEHYFRHI